jgi:hypothetical protein
VEFAGTSYVDYPEIRPSDYLRGNGKLQCHTHTGKYGSMYIVGREGEYRYIACSDRTVTLVLPHA